MKRNQRRRENFLLTIAHKNDLQYQEHQGRSLRAGSGIETLSEQFEREDGLGSQSNGRNGNQEHAFLARSFHLSQESG